MVAAFLLLCCARCRASDDSHACAVLVVADDTTPFITESAIHARCVDSMQANQACEMSLDQGCREVSNAAA